MSTAANLAPPANEIITEKADPYPYYARLRAESPVHFLDWPGYGDTWFVTRYREALNVFKDSRFVRNRDSLSNPDEAERSRQVPFRGFGRDLLELDPPDHTRLRKLVGKAFTPRMVERLDVRVEALAGQLLDLAAKRGEIDVVSEYATVIPITIISELMGLPINDFTAFRAFVYALIFNQIVGRTNETLDAQKAQFRDVLQRICAERRRDPRNDLITALVEAEQDGDRLSPDELTGMVFLLLIAGFLTTANLIGNGTLALLRNPDQLALLRQRPDLTQSAIEELLRYDGPLEVSSVCYASCDVELDGHVIPKGAPVRVIIPSANRDASEFPDPDRLDIARDPCPHLSFGQGIHYCLGAPLARLEGRIALRMLVDRFPNLRIGDPQRVIWQPHPILRGLQLLPLRF